MKPVKHFIINNIESKYCARCKQLLPLDSFWKHKNRTIDGLEWSCKKCMGNQTRAKHNRLYRTPKGYLGRLISFCKKKGRICLLSIEQVTLLLSAPCSYCGETEKFRGIDRINSKLGYVDENVTTCCNMCNEMKLDYTLDEFKTKLIQIVKYLNLLS
jgi:hypothetical protein